METPISELQERYNLSSRQAVYDRLTALELKPVSRGKISDEQLDKLDKLNDWLKENPGSAIADFPLHPEVMPSEKLDKSLSTATVDKSLDKPDNFTEALQLVEAIARHFQQQRDPLENYKALIFAAEQQLILPSSKVTELIGTKPKGEQFERGSFRFTRSGKIGGQSAWKVQKWL